ncbi:hypothetical protein PHMEG_00025219 [Phytophthora megakarya]|uniref:Uncharacterized protein n=1 Tax=Phytophthora megakarya TaxID=4795 RepID=A0A225VDT0_9STRA|nr:hypothetical protein PHMEG_00025219 [Phytophthora megakarya]
MLPALSDKVGSNRQLLVSNKIAPSTLPTGRRQNALLELKRVNAIRVSPADKGKKHWSVIEVFMGSSTIPEELRNDMWARDPTIRVERKMLNFVTLRHDVYYIVREAHLFEHCKFCSGVMDLVVFGANPDGFLVRLIGGKRLARTQAMFVVGLLTLLVQHLDITTRSCCAAQRIIPRLVHKFLFA